MFDTFLGPRGGPFPGPEIELNYTLDSLTFQFRISIVGKSMSCSKYAASLGAGPCGWMAAALILFSAATASAQDAPAATAPAATAPAPGKTEAAQSKDVIHDLQKEATTTAKADWGYWGFDPQRWSTWTSHSNRLIPVYTFGIALDAFRGEGNPYHSEEALQELYGRVPENTLNPDAEYFDQTNIYDLQQQAIRNGKRHIILVVFDGMDWQTTQAAAIHAAGRLAYTAGPGTGLSFQDYDGTAKDFGFFVTSPYRGYSKLDVDAQLVLDADAEGTGGYDPRLGGPAPWATPASRDYLIGQDRSQPHTVTDSASSATSLMAGIKTYNAAINVSADGKQVEPIGRTLQRERGFAVGLVSSVPNSHATPASGYANNVTRNDYQDISRDQIGLPSVAHRSEPLPGADVVLGGGWGEIKDKDAAQGANYAPGNKFISLDDVRRVSLEGGGPYVTVERTAGSKGSEILAKAAAQARAGNHRLLGIFGASGGNLPFRTADGAYNPTFDITGSKTYSQADVTENPTLADMARAALSVLEKDPEGFWLLVEAGDVDWANHANNLDNSIGAVISGADAFTAITEWVEANDAWDSTAVILTADHGHYFHLTRPEALLGEPATGH